MTTAPIPVRRRFRLRHWWFRRRLTPFQRELLQKIDEQLAREMLYGKKEET